MFHHRIHDGKSAGAVVVTNARGRLEHCTLWGNADGGLAVAERGDPTLAACVFRDHCAGQFAYGLFVDATARGGTTVGAGCVFLRNAKGGVVRA